MTLHGADYKFCEFAMVGFEDIYHRIPKHPCWFEFRIFFILLLTERHNAFCIVQCTPVSEKVATMLVSTLTGLYRAALTDPSLTAL
eukprot:2283575-Amphidinium_carterae.6